jgi:peptidoglycan/xylan/chitin deacetylase (PgdA/CDA1 family)
MISVFVVIATAGILFRNEELELLGRGTRFVRAIDYRIQYAMYDPAARQGATAALSLATTSPAYAGDAASVPVLLYHGIVREADRFSLTEETFKDQLFALKRAGYETITLEEFEAFLAGERELPARSFLLTFDDGRMDSYERADPLLAALDYSAVMFVATQSSLDAPREHSDYYIDTEDLRRMLTSGRWEVASHARQETGGMIAIEGGTRQGNFLSNRGWRPELGRLETAEEYAARAVQEIKQSKTELEETFSVPVTAFSYPFGDYGQQTDNMPEAGEVIADAVRSAYAVAFRQVWPRDPDFSENYPVDNVIRLRRIEVDTSWGGDELLAFLERTAAKPLPYTDPLDTDAGWKHSWGILNLEGGRLTLGASTEGAGAFTFLDGTRGWRAYRYEVDASRAPGTTLSLIARYQNGDNYVTCSFDDERLLIDERVGGSMRRLAEKPAPIPSEGTFAMRVEGNTASCESGDTVIYSAILSESLDSGGIGLRTWSETLGAAKVSVDELRVTPLP